MNPKTWSKAIDAHAKVKNQQAVTLNRPNERRVRCGRQHLLINMMHSRLRGYMCVCGSQEWEEIPEGERDA